MLIFIWKWIKSIFSRRVCRNILIVFSVNYLHSYPTQVGLAIRIISSYPKSCFHLFHMPIISSYHYIQLFCGLSPVLWFPSTLISATHLFDYLPRYYSSSLRMRPNRLNLRLLVRYYLLYTPDDIHSSILISVTFIFYFLLFNSWHWDPCIIAEVHYSFIKVCKIFIERIIRHTYF